MDTLKKNIEVLKALSDENRLRIILMLSERAICVCEIKQVLNIALSTISAHLKKLKYAGIIIDNKDGRWVEYSLTDDPQILELIKTIKSNLKECKSIIEDLQKISKIDKFSCQT